MTSQTAPMVDVEGLYRRHLSSGRARMASILGGQVEASSQGAIVTDAAGTEYLNCGGYGVFLLGHGHPAIVEAVRSQVERHPLTTRLFLDGTQALAAEALAGVSPSGLDHVYFATSGADAVEAALKLGRMHGKRKVVSTVGGFHGKTFGALSVSGNPILRDPFEPLVPGVTNVPFGDADAMASALAAAPGECCVILEPIQAEGGVRVPPPDYLRAVAEACRTFDALLIVDEIATGLGRVGSWWACDQDDVVPDVMLVGKPLSGGIVPVSAIVASEDAFSPLDRDPFIHSATFSASPIAMAAVSATIDVLVEDRVPERAAELGRSLLDGLSGALAEAIAAGVVRELRGVGLLMGIEFAAPALAGDFEIELVNRRVVPNHCMNQHGVVRLTPPALLTDVEVAWLLDAVEQSANAVTARRRLRGARS
ncbi:MAG: aminotransferase class III-fold pyridoxal phosphate-dependent enzyme [Actinomycetota bacterium]|nr:aminotransferase class III-fold pyridoxal phosphate-dependent enzyme [Actinomycetota bacterium]